MGSNRQIANLLLEQKIRAARTDFYAFRQLINPGMKDGWWQREVAGHLEQFVRDLFAGLRPELVIEAPPQHGKECSIDTPVMTTRGWKNHGDLAPGDYVFHPSGRAIAVVANIPQPQPCTLEVTLSNNDRIKVHRNHEWTVTSPGCGYWVTMGTENILLSGLINGKNVGGKYRYQLPLTKFRELAGNKDKVSITDISEIDPVPGNCIQVDSDDGLYLVGKTMQPTHNSIQIIDISAWISGLNPELKTIYTSFSNRLGIRANLRLQRIYDGNVYQRIFPETRINKSNVVTIAGSFLRNREQLEYVGCDGGFRNTTVGGSITGESLDLGILDDPIKGRKEANSITVRNTAWDWLNDDFFTRFSERAGFLSILTRWHVDDPIGRMKEKNPNLKILSYPAIAENGENGREIGEALFPEHKSLDFLMLRKGRMATHSWLSLYQQRPTIIGGNIIRGDWFGRYRELPKMKYRAIFGDTAQKKAEANDYQVAECWGLGENGSLYLIDVLRDKFEAYELEVKFPDFWKKHKADKSSPLRYFGIEDKSSGTELIQKMRKKITPRIPVKAIPRSTDKFTRVQDVAGFIEAGHVMLPESAPWVHDFIAECEAFTADDAHDYDDQIDPMCDAISLMLNASRPSLAEIL